MSRGNEPAYPAPNGTVNGNGDYCAPDFPGMTLREHFAGLAMQGIMANPSGEPKGDFELEHFAKVVATMAVRHADALLAELTKDRHEQER